MINGKYYNGAPPLAARSRPQYHYFYGSTEDDDEADKEVNELDESLFGEELVPTDHEEETPPNSRGDLQHLLITNQISSKSRSSTEHTASNIPVTLLVIALLTLFLLVLPHTGEPMTADGVVPYTHIDRAEYGDPVEGFISMDLFHPSLLSETKPRSFVFPFPTGAFWTNLCMQSAEEKISYPIVVYPYAYKWAESSLLLSYPAAHRTNKKLSIQDEFEPDLTISTTEIAQNRFITKFDPLSVTLRFVSTSESKWETTLVQGSPYTTIKILNATPVFTPLTSFKSVQCPGDDTEKFSDIIDNDEDGGRNLFGVCSIDESSKKKTTIRGVQFIFKTSEGLSWILFSSEPMNLEFDSTDKTTIKSTGAFTGIIRLAYIPTADPTLSKSTNKTADASTGLRRLIYHAGIYPTGGQVSWDFHSPLSSTGTNPGQKDDSQSGYATVTFNYATQTMIDTSRDAAKPLLMLALPHHAEVLNKHLLLNLEKFDLVFHSIKGPLTPVVGNAWSYDEPLMDIGFDGPIQDIDPSVRQILIDQIDEDLGQVLPSGADDIYGFAKQVGRLAQLTHISKMLQKKVDKNNELKTETDVLDKAIALLSNYLELFLSSEVTDRLYFDSNLGGLVSNNGLLQPGEDFGNGRYNDHHFHYGYILYACAVMGNLDPVFVERFGPNVDAIFRDVAHPLSGDSQDVEPGGNLFFPFTRHKSWFDGHSFATGLFPFATGKSQESSSEAANCYYGAYLWSLVRHGRHSNSDLTDFARLLLSMEIRSAKTYWHMVPPTATNTSNVTQIYNIDFQENYMVGNVGMLDVTANTWFGNDPLYVHLINVLPITAVTGVLFEKDYVKYQYPFLMESRKSVEMAWRGYTVSILAILDPDTAWEEARDLKSYQLDSALSKSQVLYWISQRPNFTSPSIDTGGTNIANFTNDQEFSSCQSHPECTAAGLTGSCCPTESNMMLDCCT